MKLFSNKCKTCIYFFDEMKLFDKFLPWESRESIHKKSDYGDWSRKLLQTVIPLTQCSEFLDAFIAWDVNDKLSAVKECGTVLSKDIFIWKFQFWVGQCCFYFPLKCGLRSIYLYLHFPHSTCYLLEVKVPVMSTQSLHDRTQKSPPDTKPWPLT